MPNLYGYPDMGRTGLAHSLLAWGRCAVWCRDTGATMLAPRWVRLRVGPYLRGESDKRNYFLTFRSGPLVGEPWRSLIRLRSQTLFAELDLPSADEVPAKPTVVVFRNAYAKNDRKMFHLIAEHGPFLKTQLEAITRPQFLPAPVQNKFIAIHVRLGDFSVLPESAVRAGATNSRLAVEWYAQALGQLRRGLNDQTPAVVFSDGRDNELSPILSLPGVTRAPRQAAITDLLSISQAAVLIASNSGFSRWGSFLGTVPRICFSGQSLSRHVLTVEPEVESDGTGALPEEFLALAAARLSPVDG